MSEGKRGVTVIRRKSAQLVFPPPTHALSQNHSDHCDAKNTRHMAGNRFRIRTMPTARLQDM